MNLLPEQNKSKIRIEYYKRLATSSILMCSVLMFLGLIPVVLVYITTTYQAVFLNRELVAMQSSDKTNTVNTNLGIVRDLNTKLSILSKPIDQGEKYAVHEILLRVIDLAGTLPASGSIKAVYISSFSYDKVLVKKGDTNTTNYVLTVSGIARSRDILLQFEKKLETDQTFANVDLPISDLIDSNNPAFSMSLTLAKK
ncbi:MAG: hypothetical protein HY226_02565 [Candidatus Vogelbacteria bacterium]|nr:hypothetical protein [Candidatus Vogelbacteria bacterium]